MASALLERESLGEEELKVLLAGGQLPPLPPPLPSPAPGAPASVSAAKPGRTEPSFGDDSLADPVPG
jgi:hypothetical protein